MMMVHRGDDQNFIERLFTSPGAIAAVLIAVLGQASISIVYQVVNNEQQAAKIQSNTDDLNAFKAQVYNLQTPLSAHVLKLEDRSDSIRANYDELTKRIDQIDVAGTRALALVTANQQRVMSQVDRLGDRLIMQDKTVSELKSSSQNVLPVVQTKLDEMTRNISRIEDQQRRIIEALDNLYSTISKIPPALRNAKPEKQ